MRVIRNIVSRGDIERSGRLAIIRSPESFDGVINLINELSEGCDDVSTFLTTQPIKSSFAKSKLKKKN